MLSAIDLSSHMMYPLIQDLGSPSGIIKAPGFGIIFVVFLFNLISKANKIDLYFL